MPIVLPLSAIGMSHLGNPGLAMPSNATTYVVAQARDELLLEATRRLDISNSFLEHLWEEGPNGFPWLLDLELYHYVGYLTAVSGN